MIQFRKSLLDKPEMTKKRDDQCKKHNLSSTGIPREMMMYLQNISDDLRIFEEIITVYAFKIGRTTLTESHTSGHEDH